MQTVLYYVFAHTSIDRQVRSGHRQRVHVCHISRDAIVGPAAVQAQPWLLQRQA